MKKMINGSNNHRDKNPVSLLLIDDEEQYRTALSRQLEVRGYTLLTAGTPAEALDLIADSDPEVLIVSLNIKGLDADDLIARIKSFKPALPVIMLSAQGGRSFAIKQPVFRFMEKPSRIEEMISAIEAAREERERVLHGIAEAERKRLSLLRWLIGAHNSRPGVLILGLILFIAIVYMPSPGSLTALLNAGKSGAPHELIAGYDEYGKMQQGQSIARYFAVKVGPSGPEAAEFRAKVTIGLLAVCMLLWVFSAMPLGMTALLIVCVMYFWGVYPASTVARGFAKDPVFFIFGVLALAAALGKTGLDRRLCSLLLSSVKSFSRLAFVFAPLLAITVSFIPGPAIIAILSPLMVQIYSAALESAGMEKDRSLAVMMFLLVCFVANLGGIGSPAGSGRNAVILGVLSGYGIDLSFAQWLALGLPLVLVLSLVIAGYFYLRFRGRITVRKADLAHALRGKLEKPGKMSAGEYKTIIALLLLLVTWILFSQKFGYAGPVLLCLVLLNVMRVITWRDISHLHWDLIALYAAAGALVEALSQTGGALWISRGVSSLVPQVMQTGTGLPIWASFLSGVLANFMNDATATAVVSSVTMPMCAMHSVSAVHSGLAVTFAASFANLFVFGTPSNAIVYALAKDPETGEQLVTFRDFLIHGTIITLLSFGVLWIWGVLGYWNWLTF